jgi:hypothetical protein
MEDGESREIETGFNDGSMVEVISGLTEGEKIIVSPNGESTSSNSPRVDGAAVFSEEDRAKLESMTDEERASYIQSLGITAPEGSGGMGGGGMGRPPM